MKMKRKLPVEQTSLARVPIFRFSDGSLAMIVPIEDTKDVPAWVVWEDLF